MVISAKIICLVVAVVLAAIAAIWAYWSQTSRLNVLAASVFFYELKDLFP